MPAAKIRVCVQLFSFYVLFPLSASLLVHDEHSHSADVLNPGSMPGGWPAAQFREEMVRFNVFLNFLNRP